MSKNKPKFRQAPPNLPTVRAGSDPDVWNNERVIFVFSTFDVKGPWGWGAMRSQGDKWKDVFEKIEGYQSVLWKNLLDGRVNHEIKIAGTSKSARNRIQEINLDIETIVSLHVTGKIRLYGIRDRKEFRIIWLDVWHDDEEQGVCPCTKKHT